jgi:hypothetical protein
MLPETLSQCAETRKKLRDIKSAHEYALSFGDVPAVNWAEASIYAISWSVFLVSLCAAVSIIPKDAVLLIILGFIISISMGAATWFIASKFIEHHIRNKPTWVMMLEEKLCSYTPIDAGRFQKFQNAVKIKGCIEEAEFKSWFEDERQAIKSHNAHLQYLSTNVNISPKGPFMTMPIVKD